MQTRFIWNFEIDTGTLTLPGNTSNDGSNVNWEFRSFWASHEIITIQGLNQSFLDLANYQIKFKSDTYYFLPNALYNLKRRNGDFFYKPILKKNNSATGFGKKINLSEASDDILLPGIVDMDVKTLLDTINTSAQKIEIEKEALIYRWETYPKIKMEIAKLRIKQDTYFTLSLESTSLSHVSTLTKQLLGKRTSSDYSTFLKGR